MQNDASGSTTAGRPLLPVKMLTLSGVRLHNLRNVTVQLPLGVMVGVCGVSGSGKSSLISDTLVPKLKELLKAKCVTGDGEEDSANEMMERLIKDMAERQGVTERLKAENQLRWVGMMNNIRSAAEEMVLNDLIYA